MKTASNLIFAAIVLQLAASAPAAAVVCPSDRSGAYLWSLAQIEGNDDSARGGRYCIMRHEWVKFSTLPYSACHDAGQAAPVVVAIVEFYTHKPISQVTPFEFAKAFHCPYARQMNREQRDYVQRFENLARR